MSEGGSLGSVAPLVPPPQGTPWTVLHLVRWSSEYLELRGVSGPRFDVEHLLAHTLGTNRLQLYLDFDRPVTSDELSRFKKLLLERAQRKPVQYILGRTSFRELDLITDARVLIPRPETEELVGAVVEQVGKWGRRDLRALEVGTGCGAIALSLIHEGPFASVVATDISADALDVARENALAHRIQARVQFRQGESLGPALEGERFHVLVSNPPYVADEDFLDLDPEVRLWEPRTALVAAGRGRAVLDDLVAGASTVLEAGGLLALEVGLGQARHVAGRIREADGFDPATVIRDLSGVERLVLATYLGGRGATA